MPTSALLNKPALPIALALALTGSVAGGVAYSATGKTATLSLDGKAQTVEFRGGTVADALDAVGLTVGAHDTLVPGADSAIEDGDKIALRRGRRVELEVDGKPQVVWVTADSVDGALAQAGVDERGLALSASRSRGIPLDGFALQVTTPKNISITVDGTTTKVNSAATSVRAALIDQGIVLDADDRLSHDRKMPLTEGLAIHAVRVRTERVVDTVPVPFGTERRDDGSLFTGSTKVLQTGKAGATRRTSERVFADGKLEKTTVVSSVRTAQPVAKVIAVGTKARPAPVPRAAVRRSGGSSSGGTVAGAGGLNWAALARCESGGNPHAVSSTGKYRGLYQFSIATWRGVGGSGDPIDASAGEQTHRAEILYSRGGRGQWPVCGRNL